MPIWNVHARSMRRHRLGAPRSNGRTRAGRRAATTCTCRLRPSGLGVQTLPTTAFGVPLSTRPQPAADGSRLQHRYDPDRMLGADAMFRSPCFRFLRGIEPSILRLGNAHPGANVLGAMGVAPQRSIAAVPNRNAASFQCASSTRRLPSSAGALPTLCVCGVAPCGLHAPMRRCSCTPSGAGANVLGWSSAPLPRHRHRRP